MLLNPSHMDLKTLSLIVRTLLLVTLQLIIYESAKSRVLHTFEKIVHNTKFIHFFTDMKVKNKFEMTKESSFGVWIYFWKSIANHEKVPIVFELGIFGSIDTHAKHFHKRVENAMLWRTLIKTKRQGVSKTIFSNIMPQKSLKAYFYILAHVQMAYVLGENCIYLFCMHNLNIHIQSL